MAWVTSKTVVGGRSPADHIRAVVCFSTEASNKDPFEKVTTNKDPFEKRPQPAFRSSPALVLVRGLSFNLDG